MPTEVAVVTKIDIQIRRSLSQLWVHVFFFFSFFMEQSFVAGSEWDGVGWGKKKRWRDSFFFKLCSICCVIWGGGGGVVARWCLGSFPLFMVSVHPPGPLPRYPDLAQHDALLLKPSQSEMNLKKKEKEISSEINPWSALIVSDAAKTLWKLPFFSLPTLTLCCRNNCFSKFNKSLLQYR